MNAAWACEDRWSLVMAATQRENALRIFEDCLNEGECFADDASTASLILCDVNRRLKLFDRSSEIATSLLKDESRDVSQVARLQLHLAEIRDNRRYRMKEAERFQQLGNKWKPRRWWEFWR